MNNLSPISQRNMKTHYHTTDNFTEYYKKFIENNHKDKGNINGNGNANINGNGNGNMSN